MEYNYWQILLLNPQIDHFEFNPVFHQFSEKFFCLTGWKANSSTETLATRTAFSDHTKIIINVCEWFDVATIRMRRTFVN